MRVADVAVAVVCIRSMNWLQSPMSLFIYSFMVSTMVRARCAAAARTEYAELPNCRIVALNLLTSNDIASKSSASRFLYSHNTSRMCVFMLMTNHAECNGSASETFSRAYFSRNAIHKARWMVYHVAVVVVFSCLRLSLCRNRSFMCASAPQNKVARIYMYTGEPKLWRH